MSVFLVFFLLKTHDNKYNFNDILRFYLQQAFTEIVYFKLYKNSYAAYSTSK